MHNPDILYGMHPVQRALSAKKRELFKLWLQTESKFKPTEKLAQSLGLKVEWVDKQKLNQLVRHDNHQGLALTCGPLPTPAWQDWLKNKKLGKILALDQIQDSQNLGALVRSAVFFGFDALLIPKMHSAALNPVASKASAGWLEQLPILKAANLAQALRAFQQKQFWLLGAALDGQVFYRHKAVLPFVLIMGNEQKGLRQLTGKLCDVLLTIPSPNKADSLNVAAAGAVLMNHLSQTAESIE